MKSKKMAQQQSSLGEKARARAGAKEDRQDGKRKDRKKDTPGKKISSLGRRNEIHDSLDAAIKKIESGKMNPKAAKEILERIGIMQTLLSAAKRELENWLEARSL